MGSDEPLLPDGQAHLTIIQYTKYSLVICCSVFRNRYYMYHENLM